MSEPVVRRMTRDEFLSWDDGTDTRYELIDGVPVAMAPAAEAHRIVANANSHHAELHRRESDRWIIDLVRGKDAVLSLGSVRLAVPMATLYEGIAIPAAAEEG